MIIRDKKILRLFVFYWLPVILWSGAIFYFSHQPGIKIGLFTTSPLEALTRKIVHIIEFGTLAFLVWRSLGKGMKWSPTSNFAGSFIIVSIWAVLDEIHQLFVINRTGLVIDAIIDVLAVFIVLQVLFVVKRRALNKVFFIGITTGFAMLVFCVGWIMIEAERTHNIGENYRARTKQFTKVKERAVKKEEKKEEPCDCEKRLLDNVLFTADEKNTILKNEILISVPFTSQSPFALWDDVHEEACEEASLMMVKSYLDKKYTDTIPKDVAEDEIQKMKVFQEKRYGTYKDSNMQELVTLAGDFYQIKNLKVIYDFKKDEIKKQLSKGNPIIVPTAGRELGNPNFTSPGPLYHNLVLKGYKNNTIITNDPGTRKGKDYEYNIDVLYNAIHDFPGNKDKILEGRKAMIIVNESTSAH